MSAHKELFAMHRPVVLMLMLIVSVSCPLSSSAGALSDLAPPGKHFKLSPDAHAAAETFKTGQPIVGTSYFYWYDVYTGAHIRDADGTDAMTTHPPEQAMTDLSYKSPAWHYWQLRDVCQAGIDFILPVFWGYPGGYEGWSFAGLGPLVEAHDRMLAEHKQDASNPLPPKIGLFYDTSTLQHNVYPDGRRNVRIDLTGREGAEWFYVTIRDFFSMIPPDKWARVDGKPIIFLYAASFAAALDDALFDNTRKRFRKDFGTDFFLVRHADWPGRADAWYQWGGALGLTVGDLVAGLGPGYDHSAVPGRKPLVVDRRDGRFYIEQWERLLRMNPARRPWIVHVETWNEWHEGTDVARSREWGTRYLALTDKYANMFRARQRLEPEGEFVNADRVRWAGRTLGGLTLRNSGGDGCWQWRQLDNREAIASTAGPENYPARYLYFNVDDSYLYDETGRVAEITIIFRDDGGCEGFRVEYDNGDPELGPRDGAFRPTRQIDVGQTGAWRMATLQLPDVRFSNRTNQADLRLVVLGGKQELTVAEVIVRRLPGQLIRMPTDTNK